MKPFSFSLLTAVSACALAFSPAIVRAQFTYPGCDDLKAADFKATELFNRHGTSALAGDETIEEPVQFDFHTVKAAGKVSQVDIYFVQRTGGVKFYDGAAKKVSDVGHINVLGAGDNGLMGIALNPDFDKNKWIYLWYSPNQKIGQNRILRLVRITVKPDNTLDMASEKKLIEILASKSDSWHSGGPMQFDAYGDMWLTIGNNSPDLDTAACSAGNNVLSKTDSTTSGEWGPSNTANMRGGILRIHPDSSEKGYRIPSGNFGEYWAGEFDKQGKTALAAEYRNPVKVLPEIYVKGNRSNYSFGIHPVKRWLAWGEVNYSSSNDEFNLVSHPVFAGYPYFHNNNIPTCNHGKDVNAPSNDSPFNNGVSVLPPATPGMINNLVNVAISGPIYVFDKSLDSPIKFPPHLHLSWFTMSFQSNQAHIHTLDTVAVKVAKTQRVDNGILSALKQRSAVEAKYGPDGALYVLNYDGFYTTINPGITRIDYVGNCHVAVAARPVVAHAAAPDARVTASALEVPGAGPHILSLYDAGGRLRFRYASAGAANYAFADLRARHGLPRGLYHARVETPQGAVERMLPLL